MLECDIRFERMNLGLDKIKCCIQFISWLLKKLILSNKLFVCILRIKTLRNLNKILLETLDLLRRDCNNKLVDGKSNIMNQLVVKIIFLYHKLHKELSVFGDSRLKNNRKHWIYLKTIVNLQIFNSKRILSNSVCLGCLKFKASYCQMNNLFSSFIVVSN